MFDSYINSQHVLSIKKLMAKCMCKKTSSPIRHLAKESIVTFFSWRSENARSTSAQTQYTRIRCTDIIDDEGL